MFWHTLENDGSADGPSYFTFRCQIIEQKNQMLPALYLYRRSIIVDHDCTVIAEMQDHTLRAPIYMQSRLL